MSIGVAIVAVAIVTLFFIGNFSSQPDIRISDQNFNILDMQNETILLVDREVSGSYSFNYEIEKTGTYTLLFNNSLAVSPFTKYVGIEVLFAGEKNSDLLEIPPMEYKKAEFELSSGDIISGEFQIVASDMLGQMINQPANIWFTFTGKASSQTLGFQFTLTNTGDVDGYATVAVALDDRRNIIWTNNYYVPKGEQTTHQEITTIPDLAEHTGLMAIISQIKT